VSARSSFVTPRAAFASTCAALMALGFGAAGCAHAPAVDDPLSSRRLLVLERDFSAFVAQPLRTQDDVEVQTAALEALRLSYLDALGKTDAPRDRLLCLLRIAELHLDLGARVRRLPYPAGASSSQRAAFDETLSQEALPLEAVGVGVLAQAIDYAETHGVDGRFVHRARLYRALHAGQSLDKNELAWLRRELGDRSFGAPRTLLEAGRVGQRAARR
jgi:hypothetical protein